MKILITNAALLDGRTTDIFIDNGVITELSGCCTRPADRTIAARNKLAVPAFINGHTHAAMTLLRGYADDMPLKQWLEEKIWVLESKLTGEDVYWGTKLACLEMIKSGTTVFNDMYWFWEDTARAVCDMGIRGILSGVFIDLFDTHRAQEQMERNTELFAIAQRYAPNVTFALGPHALYSVSVDSLRWLREFSDRHGTLVHMHLCETEDETRFTQEKYGMSPPEFLDSLGLLTRRFVGAHGCWLTQNDVKVLRRTGANLVNNPVSNLKLAVGRVFPYRLVADNEIPFCLGTDGCSSNNHLDMIETMKYASLIAKFSTNDPTFLPARETIGRATTSAGQIFSLGTWEIAEGAATDILLIDLDRPEFVPNFDNCSDLVYSANGYAVDTVICMGRIIMEHRHVEGEEEIMARARTVAQSLSRR